MYHYGYYGLDRGVAAISPTTGSAQLFDADLHPIQTVTFSFSGSLTAATESSVSENVVMVDRSLLAVASQLDGGGIYMATLDDGVIRRSGAGNGLYSFLSRPSTPDSGVIAYQAVGDGSYTQQFFGVDPSQDGPVLPAPAGTTDAL